MLSALQTADPCSRAVRTRMAQLPQARRAARRPNSHASAAGSARSRPSSWTRSRRRRRRGPPPQGLRLMTMMRTATLGRTAKATTWWRSSAPRAWCDRLRSAAARSLRGVIFGRGGGLRRSSPTAKPLNPGAGGDQSWRPGGGRGAGPRPRGVHAGAGSARAARF